jgi:hypothetical protein
MTLEFELAKTGHALDIAATVIGLGLLQNLSIHTCVHIGEPRPEPSDHRPQATGWNSSGRYN